jgi:predicted PolB exonuclease-like 3'-5' exonuclease
MEGEKMKLRNENNTLKELRKSFAQYATSWTVLEELTYHVEDGVQDGEIDCAKKMYQRIHEVFEELSEKMCNVYDVHIDEIYKVGKELNLD